MEEIQEDLYFARYIFIKFPEDSVLLLEATFIKQTPQPCLEPKSVAMWSAEKVAACPVSCFQFPLTELGKKSMRSFGTEWELNRICLFHLLRYFKIWKPFLSHTMMKLNWRETLILCHPRITNIPLVRTQYGRGRPYFSAITPFFEL